MIILVTGGRDFNDKERVFKKLDEIIAGVQDLNEVSVIQGGARGADSLGRLWAKDNWIYWKSFDADWNQYGKRAGPIRNQQMIDECEPDLCVAFPGGRGTADMVRRCKKAGIKVVEG